MPNNQEQKIKLLVLYDILYRKTNEENAMTSDEIVEELKKREITVSRRVIASDIALLNEYGYEVLSYKKKSYYYYGIDRMEKVQVEDCAITPKSEFEKFNVEQYRRKCFLCSMESWKPLN